MHRHRNLVAECHVIKDVDAEEEDDVQEPAPDRDGVGFEEERRVLERELMGPCE